MNNSEEKSAQAKDYAQAIVDTIREPLLVLDGNLKVISANNNFYTTFEVNERETEGKLVYELGNNQWNIPALRTLLEEVLPKKKNIIDFEVTHHFQSIGKRTILVNANQLRREKGEKKLILLSFKDVTKQLQDRESEKYYLKRFQNIIMQAPAIICTLKGPDHVFELANEKYFQLVGNRDIIGKPIREALPELEDQGFYEMLDKVYKTGESYFGNEVFVKLGNIGGKQEDLFQNFSYQAMVDTKGNVDGIFVHAVDVTEQVQARKKVEQSEQQIRSLIESAPFPIAVYEGREMKIAYTNQSVINLWKKGDDLIGKLFSEVFPELESQHVYEQLDHVYTTGEPFQATNQKIDFVINGEMETYYFNYTYTPLFDSSANVYGIMNTAADVTELNLAKKKIEESEHSYREMIYSSPSMIATFKGEDMIIEIANDAILKAWGRKKEVIGKPLFTALPEIVEQGFVKILQGVYQTGKTSKAFEKPIKLFRNGKMEWGYFNFMFYPKKNANGDITGVFHIATEVTPQAEMNKKIRESESHFRQMADLMPGKVLNTDARGNAIYFNRHWLNDSGLDFEALKNRGWQKWIHSDDFEEFIGDWKESLTTGKEFEMEFRFLNKNGTYKWHLGRAVPVKDELGGIKLWISSAIEIQKLKEEEKRKEDFLKMVSHELKTPVTSIKGYVQLLLSLLDVKKDSQVSSIPIKPSLERIDNQIGRLTRLIAEMLDISRIEENKLELKKETFSINELVNETVQDINYTNTQHKIEIFHDFECKVHADKDRIGQVLINFVTNAIKYSPENQHVEVKIQEVENNKVSISIKDKGIGIDKINHKNIFKRFYRVGGKNEETYSGFGIGLYLANEIIERHQGYITVKSKRGKGSEFSFALGIASAN